jgi:N-acetylmuramoyl-L-alanine amidase
MKKRYLGLVFVLLPAVLLAAGKDVEVEIRGDFIRTSSLPAREVRGIVFVPVAELADLLEAPTYYNSLAQKLVIVLGNHRVKVTALNSFVMVDDKVFQLPLATEFDDRGIWVPIDYFLEVIRGFTPAPLSYDRARRKLILHVEDMNILGVTAEEKINGVLLRIQTLRKFDPSNLAVRISQGWLYVDIYGGRLDTTRIYFSGSNRLLRKMVPIQFSESAQLSFRLAKEIRREDITLSAVESEILVSIRTKTDLPKDVLVDLEKERRKWLIDTIILDPGHGGKDPGTIGYGGLKEKDIVLDVAKRLKKLLEKRLGVKVLMTRESDRFVGLRQRSAFANKHKGKLFISIHANSNRNRRAYGVETYCLGTARTEEDRQIAELENSVIRYEDSWAEYGDLSNENYILLSLAQNSFNKESQELAAFIQRSIARRLGTRSRGIKQAGFMVLVGTAMPKVLVEIGFISNPREAKRLRSRAYRQKIAEAIYRGIKEFKERSERIVLGSLRE